MKNLLLFVILVAFLLVPDALISKKYTRKQDSLELIKFYDATDGDNWLINTGWKDRQLPVWQWHGVGIDWIVKNQDTMVVVIEIELEQNELKGNLPELNLPDLFGIFVAKNRLCRT